MTKTKAALPTAILGLLAVLLAVPPAAAQESLAPRPPLPSSALPALVAGATIFGASWIASEAASLEAETLWLQRCNRAEDAADAANRQAYGSLSNDVTAITANVNQIVTCGITPSERFLTIPLAGPWMTLAHGQWGETQRMALVGDGIVQAAGFALLAYGILRVAVKASRTTGPEPRSIFVQPSVGSAGTGLTVIGTF